MAKRSKKVVNSAAKVSPMGGGGGQTLYFYSYEVISVPEGCTTYVKDSIIRLALPDNPPPGTITVGGTGPCAGTVLQYYGP